MPAHGSMPRRMFSRCVVIASTVAARRTPAMAPTPTSRTMVMSHHFDSEMLLPRSSARGTETMMIGVSTTATARTYQPSARFHVGCPLQIICSPCIRSIAPPPAIARPRTGA